MSSEISEALQNFGVVASLIYSERCEMSRTHRSEDTKLSSTKPFPESKAVILKPSPDIDYCNAPKGAGA
jgi:hypothetical protein